MNNTNSTQTSSENKEGNKIPPDFIRSIMPAHKTRKRLQGDETTDNYLL